jgi:hypothetical protein
MHASDRFEVAGTCPNRRVITEAITAEPKGWHTVRTTGREPLGTTLLLLACRPAGLQANDAE